MNDQRSPPLVRPSKSRVRCCRNGIDIRCVGYWILGFGTSPLPAAHSLATRSCKVNLVLISKIAHLYLETVQKCIPPSGVSESPISEMAAQCNVLILNALNVLPLWDDDLQFKLTFHMPLQMKWGRLKNVFLLPRPRSHEASPYIEPDCADCSLRFRPHALRSEERLSQFLADLSDVLFDFLHQFQFRVRRSHLLQRNTQDCWTGIW